MKKYRPLAFIFGVLLFWGLACGSNTSEKLANIARQAEQPTRTEAQPVGEQIKEQPASTTQSENLPPPTAVPAEPTPTPAAELEKITVVKSGFGQDKREIGFGFIVRNPNPGHAFENTRFQIALYDAAGTVLETDSGFIEIILPGQSLGVGGNMFVDEGKIAARMEVQLQSSPSDAVAIEPVPDFSVGSPAYFTDDFFSSVTGEITNPYNKDLENIRVSAIAYDQNGEINGGGFTYVNFILAQSATGVRMSVTSSVPPANLELYPSVSGLTFLATENKLPAGAQPLNLAKSGYGQDGTGIGYGFIVENPNEGFGIEGTQYRITMYAADGRVLETDEGFIEIILPSQTLGVGGDAFSDEPITRAEVQILPGQFGESDPIPPFASENVNYAPNDYFPTVTGEVVSPYQKDVTDVRSMVIAYNAEGQIIGGGFTYVDFIPANGKAAVEVSVTTSGIPSTVELYTALSGLSGFEE